MVMNNDNTNTLGHFFFLVEVSKHVGYPHNTALSDHNHQTLF